MKYIATIVVLALACGVSAKRVARWIDKILHWLNDNDDRFQDGPPPGFV